MAQLEYKHFVKVIQRHDRFNLQGWRKMFAENTMPEKLANFYINQGGYPHSKRFTLAKITNVFRTGPQNKGLTYKPDFAKIYTPWNGWWTGKWYSAGSTTGIPQFHIWDKTYPKGTRFFQLVSQSTKDFAHKNNWNLFKSRYHNQTASGKHWLDLALNVYDSKNGVTGWVTKKRIDLPHLGYLVDKQTLLWITWVGGKYYLYDEHSKGNTYRMDGRPFTYNKAVGFQPSMETHRGVYQCKKNCKS